MANCYSETSIYLMVSWYLCLEMVLIRLPSSDIQIYGCQICETLFLSQLINILNVNCQNNI